MQPKSRYHLCNILEQRLQTIIHVHGPINTSPSGRYPAPLSAADNAAVLPMEIAHTETHLQDKYWKYERNSCMNLRPTYLLTQNWILQLNGSAVWSAA